MNAHTAVFQSDTTHWPAVFSLFMGVTCLIAAEFMPVSLLTPMARDLAVTEGMAGQTVTAVGVFAVLTSLLLSPLTRGMDRRRILLAFSLLLIVSNLAWWPWPRTITSSWPDAACWASAWEASGPWPRRSLCSWCPQRIFPAR